LAESGRKSNTGANRYGPPAYRNCVAECLNPVRPSGPRRANPVTWRALALARGIRTAFHPAGRTGSWSLLDDFDRVPSDYRPVRRGVPERARSKIYQYRNKPWKWAGSPPQNERGWPNEAPCLVAEPNSSVIRKSRGEFSRRWIFFQSFRGRGWAEQAGWKLAPRSPLPDAVLLDWNMPKMDGL